MALTPEHSDALIREVDDAVRQDDIMSFWTRYGRMVLVAIGVALVAFAGWLLWQSHERSVAEGASENFAMMLKAAGGAQLDQENYDKVAKSGSAGYRTEADLVKAAIAAGRGDAKSAIASYDAIHADANAPEPLRQLALVRRTALAFDTLQPQQVVDALKPLAVAGNPWFGSAGEMTAIAYLKMNKKKEAGDMFASLSRDLTVTETIRQRAGQMASMLGVAPTAIGNVEQAGA